MLKKILESRPLKKLNKLFKELRIAKEVSQNYKFIFSLFQLLNFLLSMKLFWRKVQHWMFLTTMKEKLISQVTEAIKCPINEFKG